MDYTYFGYLLALLIGISLGVIGSGGSILTVPILVYILKIEPFIATAYSLFIVGSTSLVGGIRFAIAKKVNFNAVLLFGIPSMISVFCTRAFLLPLIPNTVDFGLVTVSKNMMLMVLFAFVMLTSAYKMIVKNTAKQPQQQPSVIKFIIQGLLIGLLAGTVGAGGGFLIIPALVLFSNLTMKEAIGTSLCIIAIQSLVGFIGDLSHIDVNWLLLLCFSAISVIGLYIGIYISKYIPDKNLKTTFGYFVLIMAFYILLKEVVL